MTATFCSSVSVLPIRIVPLFSALLTPPWMIAMTMPRPSLLAGILFVVSSRLINWAVM
ncbi:hypothetical protein D3C71_2164280 [compost metagenome]